MIKYTWFLLVLLSTQLQAQNVELNRPDINAIISNIVSNPELLNDELNKYELTPEEITKINIAFYFNVIKKSYNDWLRTEDGDLYSLLLTDEVDLEERKYRQVLKAVKKAPNEDVIRFFNKNAYVEKDDGSYEQISFRKAAYFFEKGFGLSEQGQLFEWSISNKTPKQIPAEERFIDAVFSNQLILAQTIDARWFACGKNSEFSSRCVPDEINDLRGIEAENIMAIIEKSLLEIKQARYIVGKEYNRDLSFTTNKHSPILYVNHGGILAIKPDGSVLLFTNELKDSLARILINTATIKMPDNDFVPKQLVFSDYNPISLSHDGRLYNLRTDELLELGINPVIDIIDFNNTLLLLTNDGRLYSLIGSLLQEVKY